MPIPPNLVAKIIRRRRSRREQKARHPARRLGQLMFAMVAAVILVAGLVLIGLGFSIVQIARSLPAIEQLETMLDPQSGSLLQPTRFFDRTDQVEIARLDNPGVQREYLYLDPQKGAAIASTLVDSIVGIEQPDFWSSPGFDLARLYDPTPSTIAEQLASTLLLWQEVNSSQKAIRMHLLGAQLVARYGREQVLEWYLNSLYFGHRAFGAQEAAWLYLGRAAQTLSLSEAALLAGTARSPALNPLDAPSSARLVQEQVLAELFVKGILTRDQLLQARSDVTLFKDQPHATSGLYDALVNVILSQLEPRFAENRLERGGLRLVTTVDVNLQLQTMCTLQTQLSRLEMRSVSYPLPEGTSCDASRYITVVPTLQQGLPPGLSGSAVILDPQTGEVLALIGDSSLGTTGQGLLSHAPGSLMTTFLAAVAFTRGVSPANLVWDIPSTLPNDLSRFTNPDGRFRGPMRLRTAIVNDVLVPQAQILDQFGAQNVWQLTEPFGVVNFTSLDNPAELLFVGGETSPLRLVQAYGVFANQGVIQGWDQGSGGLSPVTVLSVAQMDGAALLDENGRQVRSILSPQLAYLVNDVLTDTSAHTEDPYPMLIDSLNRPAGLKIGQTTDGLNSWMVGYTPQRVMVTWLGLPAGTTEARLTAGMSAQWWLAVMKYAHQGLPALGWSPPPGISTVDVCDPSGMLPTGDCPTIVQEIFLTGNEPLSMDPLYQEVLINRETGRLATVYTSPELIEKHVFLVVPEQARQWAEMANLPLPPEEYDLIQPQTSNPNIGFSSPAAFLYVSGKVDILGTASGAQFQEAWVEVGKGIAPQRWLRIGETLTQPVLYGLLAEWDTSGLDGLYAIRLIVLHPDQTFETAVLQVTVDNTPPVLSVPYPQPDEKITLPENGTLTLLATASDNLGLKRVEWWLDGEKVAERTIAPYAYPVAMTAGSHILVVKAVDIAGNVVESGPTKFRIAP
jgi:membrane peptidoglycan carboxypeptidase